MRRPLTMNKKRLFIIAPLFALASCGGYSVQYLVEGNKYNSPVFGENYYTHWDSDLKNCENVVEHKIEEDHRILSFKDIGKIDRQLAVDNPYKVVSDYGPDYCLSSYDESFNYGVQSKLFDGKVYCEGYTTRRRVQIDNKGFSVRFAKESEELSYFAVNFKAAIDFTDQRVRDYFPTTDLGHKSVLNSLTVSIYLKNDNEQIVKHNFVTENIVIPATNQEAYYFYAFDLTKFELSRMIGFSMEYDFTDDVVQALKKEDEPDVLYSLFLYEVFLPYTFWH